MIRTTQPLTANVKQRESSPVPLKQQVIPVPGTTDSLLFYALPVLKTSKVNPESTGKDI